MPARTRTRIETGGGFGGFAPNPNFQLSDGRRVVTSDVQQAQDAMTFGGGTTTSPTPNPSSSPSFNNEWTTSPDDRRFLPSPSPTAQPSGLSRGNIYETQPPFQIDPRWSGKLEGNPNDLNYIPPTVGDIPGSLDTRFVGGLESPETIASGGGRSPSITTDPNLDWTGSDEQLIAEGLPRAIDPSDSGLWHGPDREQISSDDLYADETTIASSGGKPPSFIDDPNQDWIGSTPPAVAQNQGVLAGFGGNMTIGQFLNTPLAFMGFGENRGAMPSGRVGGGDIAIGSGANTRTYHTPGDPGTVDLNAPVSAEAEANFQAAQEQGARETAEAQARGELPPSTDPASRFGNLNSPTGQAVYRDAQGNWRPVSGAPSDIRWDPSSGTGNFQASETTKAYLSGGQQPGNPNNTASFATEGRFLMDDEGAPTMQGAMYGSNRSGEFRGKQGGPASYGDAASQLAYSNWLRQQPEYKAWMKTRGG